MSKRIYKFSPRDSYLIVDIKGSVAVLQKMDFSKQCFRSRTYEVPLTSVYPTVIDQSKFGLMSDCVTNSHVKDSTLHDSPDSWETSSSSSDSSVDVAVPGAPRELTPPEAGQSSHSEVVPRRSARVRQQPNRFNSMQYNSDIPFENESEVVENWWPNHPRGARSSENDQE